MRIVHLTGYHDPGSTVRSFFGISGRFIGEFPLTFTVLECAEAWCDFVGWDLKYFVKNDDTFYTLIVGVGMYENIDCTIAERRVVCV